MMGVTDLLPSDADGHVYSWWVDTYLLGDVGYVLDHASYCAIHTRCNHDYV